MSARHASLLVVLITLVGLALRAALVGQSLLGDELFTHEIATRDSLGGVFDGILDTELNPPLYFVMAWLAGKLGDPLIAIRAPALILGVAAIPLVYLVGRRLVGQVPALIGTALFALAPFAVYYGSEARAYSTLTFLALLSTYALLRALDNGSRWWWVLFSFATCAVMYTHYTGAFVLLGQVAWALWAHRDSWRPVVISCAAAAIAYAPWVPNIRENVPVDIIEIVFPLTPRNFVRGIARLFPGHPYQGVEQVPGRVALVLVVCGLLLAIGFAVWRLVAARRVGRRIAIGSGLALVVVLTVASPAGAVVADWFGQPIYLSRNLIASLAPMCLLIGWLVARMPAKAAVAAGLLIVGGTAIGTVRGLQEENGRPQFGDAVEWVEDRARPGDPIAQASGFRAQGALAEAFTLHFDRPHPTFSIYTDPEGAVAAAERRGRLFILSVRAGDVPPDPTLPPAFRLVERKRFPGTLPIEALEYAR